MNDKLHTHLSPVIVVGVVSASHGAGVDLVNTPLIISSNAVRMPRMNSASKVRGVGPYIVKADAASAVLTIDQVVH